MSCNAYLPSQDSGSWDPAPCCRASAPSPHCWPAGGQQTSSASSVPHPTQTECNSSSSVADPYQFNGSGSEKFRYGSGSRPNFDTDPALGKIDTEPDPDKKGIMKIRL